MAKPEATIVGIDPGLDGAIAVLQAPTGGSHRVWFTDMPVFVVKKDKRTRRVFNYVEIANILRPFSSAAVFIENVHAMRKGASSRTQGVASAFNFGVGKGILLGVVGAFHLRHVLVAPIRWKRFHNLIGTDKDASRRRALELYPGCASNLSRKKDIGRADALLIADYGLNSTQEVRDEARG